ncbi:uncharacterized protein [Amphiura filiformis]|uniref:uncharacterized protein n=1 Tax=Amphiura filiformis TaxID=82378 RepID=UPI003B21900E
MFVLDLTFHVTLDEIVTDFVILNDIQIPIPLCNDDFFLPGNGTIEGFVKAIGDTVGQTAVDVVLSELGIQDYITNNECTVPATIVDPSTCPAVAEVPSITNNIECTPTENCLGIECCVNIDFKIARLMLKTWLTVDICQFRFAMGFENWSKNLSMYAYDWDLSGTEKIGDFLTMKFSFGLHDTEPILQVSLTLNLCVDNHCEDIPIFNGISIPLPRCDGNGIIPGDGTVEGFLTAIGGTVGAVGINFIADQLGIGRYVTEEDCRQGQLVQTANSCPSISLSFPPDILSCRTTQYCTGIQCCVPIDIKVDVLFLNVWLSIDPCNYELSIGLGRWSYTKAITRIDWGIERIVNVGDALQIVYTVSKLDEEKSFSVDLSVVACIDGNCVENSVVSQLLIPIPLCNPNGTLPGNGTFAGVFDQFAEDAANNAIELALKSLGINEFLSDATCMNDIREGCPELPTLPTQTGIFCGPTNFCQGFECCVDLDLTVTRKTIRVYLTIDFCNYQISVGFGEWFKNFTLFTYDWSTEEMHALGSAIMLRFSIDKLDADKEFVLDLSFQLKIEGVTTDFNILSATRVPIPLCNENTTFSLPGDGSIGEFARIFAGGFSHAAVNTVLEQLGLKDHLSEQICDVPQTNLETTQCPAGFQIPAVENILHCSVDERCLGIECCVSLDFKITSLMLKTWLILDPCNFTLSVGFENAMFNLTLFTYKWGKMDMVEISEFLHLRFSINKLTDEDVFSITLGIELCIDGNCEAVSVLKDLKVPIPICNIDVDNFKLPGDGTVEGFVQQLGNDIGDSAIDLVIQKLGLIDFFSSTDCRNGGLSVAENNCPSANLPVSSDILACHPIQHCFDIHCCVAIDIKVTQIFVNAWLTIDPCNLEVSIGLGNWIYNETTTFADDKAVIKSIQVAESLNISYSLVTVEAEKAFSVELDVVICMDNNCEIVSILSDLLIPIPFCNTNDTLPGGSIESFVNQLPDGGITDAVIDMVLKTFGLSEFITDSVCVPSTTGESQGCPGITTPNNCNMDDNCLGFHCCVNIDLKVIRKSVEVYLTLDPCNFVMYVGFGEWLLNKSLFTYKWGTEERLALGNAINIRFTVDKLTEEDQFELSLSVELSVDGATTTFPVLTETNIPIPLCNNESSFVLPGDGSIQGFARDIGDNVGQSAVDLVLLQLDLKEHISQDECVVSQVNISNTDCPANFNVPVIECSVNEACLTFDCCVNLDFKISTLMLKTWFSLDPCNFQFSIGFEQLSFNFSLFSYEFGKMETIAISDFLRIRYAIDKLHNLFSLHLSIILCIDDVCERFIVFKDLRIPSPWCDTDYTSISRPGGGTIDGFVQYLGEQIGDTAVYVVMEKLGLKIYVSNEDCREGALSGTENNCPVMPEPASSGKATCKPTEYCTGVKCCTAIDIKITQLYVNAWMDIDPCDFKVAIGFGDWSLNISMINHDWGVERYATLGDSLQIMYSIDRSEDMKNFIMNLSAIICFDGNCETTSILSHQLVPKPFCYENGTLALPGNGTIDSYLHLVSENTDETVVDMVLSALGVKEYVTDTGCLLPSNEPNCPGLTLPDINADGVSCDIDALCLGFQCCLDMDFIVTRRNIKTHITIDPCDFKLSVGLGEWFLDVSFFTYTWGTEISKTLGRAIKFS